MPLEIVQLKEAGRDRYLAALTDGREIRVSTAIVADLSLYSGKQLSDDGLRELEGASRFLSCRERALRIIGARAMSCKEIFDRLVQKGESTEDAEDCVEWLLERHYLDDAKYAAMLVRHYSAKGYGAQRVKNELYRRGIAKTLWDDALSELPESDETVYRLLCARLRGDTPDRMEIKRATDYLYRRGYSWDEIRSAVNRFKDESEYTAKARQNGFFPDE